MRLISQPDKPAETIADLFEAVDPQEIFRFADGPRIFGVSPNHIYTKIASGELPKPFKLFATGHSVGWSGFQVNEHRRKIADMARGIAPSRLDPDHKPKKKAAAKRSSAKGRK
jgi:predicted DNA-binding transcriptional regulator AlpA